jgi:carbon-monoxide dehydrogenase large subunit
MRASKGKLVGTSPRRKDALEALLGKATYTGDIQFPGMLHAAIYRSPYAHALIRSVDLSRARELPGVVAAVSGKELPDFVKPIPQPPYGVENACLKIRRPAPTCLAIDKVRFAGEPVAIVIAGDPYVAEDAVELIDADFDMLPAVVDAERALDKDSPLLYEEWGDNLILRYSVSGGDVESAFKQAAHVFKETIRSSRFTGTPIEPRGVVARYDEGSRLLEIWDTTQSAYTTRDFLLRSIALPGLDVRVTVPRLGGSFGAKMGSGMEQVAVAMMACLTKKPIKWVAERSEEITGGLHGREQAHHLEAAVANDGTILGLKDRIVANVGAGYIPSGLTSIRVTALYVPGVYRIQNYLAELFGAATNKTPFGAHRGFGKADAAYVIERLMDIIARRLGIDPLEIRRRNFIRPEEFPYRNATGSRYDSGSYQKTLDKAVALFDYARWRERQAEARKAGRWIGIGAVVVLEPTSSHRGGVGSYYAVRMRMEPSGKVWVFPCGNDDGAGHSTAIAQIVADELGIGFEDVNSIEGDSLLCPYGSGSHSSRFSALGAAAIMLAARELKKKILAIAAALFDAGPEGLEIRDGKIRAADDSRELSLQEVTRVAYAAIHRLPEGLDPGLEILFYYRDPNLNLVLDERGREGHYSAFPYGADLAAIEVDPQTGKIDILKYVSVHDCGNMINPIEVAGQHLGALAHGIGGTFYEEIVYDEEMGQPLTVNFKDYLVPTAMEVPRFELDHTTTPAPFTPGGFKGAGETGAVSPPPCLANALEDALAPLGIEVRSLPLKPDFVRELMRRARLDGGESR